MGIRMKVCGEDTLQWEAGTALVGRAVTHTDKLESPACGRSCAFKRL